MKIKNTCMLFLTAMIWGFAFTAQCVGAEHVGNYTFNGIRFALGSVSLLPVILLLEKKEADRVLHKEKIKKSFSAGVLAGVVLFIASTLQMYGIAMTHSAGKSGFLTGLYIVLVPIFGIFIKKKTNLNVWIGVIFALLGAFLLTISDDWEIGHGDIFLITGAVFWAIHILVIDNFVADVYPLRFSSIQFAVVSIIGLICAVLFETMTISGIKGATIPILYTGILSTGVAYTCQALGQKDADPTYAAMIFSTESVFSAIGGALLLHEVLEVKGYVGCALIFIGIIISQLKPYKRRQK